MITMPMRVELEASNLLLISVFCVILQWLLFVFGIWPLQCQFRFIFLEFIIIFTSTI